MQILNICHIFILAVFENPFCEVEDIHNSMLLRGVDSISNSACHLPLKMSHSLPQQYQIFMKVWKDGLMVNIFNFAEETFDICCQSKDITDFHNLQGKLEPMLLTV